MSQSTQAPGTTGKTQKITVGKDGNRWEVTFPCGCPDRLFRTYSVALTFAVYHACPPPWAPVPLRRKFGRGWK